MTPTDTSQTHEIVKPDFAQSEADAKLPITSQEKKQEPFFYTIDDILNLPDPEWLIQDIFAEDGIAAVVGPSKGGKSFLAIELAFCVARGEPFFGYETKRSPVAYLCFEGQGRFKYRIAAWKKVHHDTIPDNFFIKYDCEFFDLKKDDIAIFPPSCLTIVDTLSAAAPEIKENSDEMKLVVKKAKEISRITGGAVLIVHHTGKDEERGSRGHTSFPAGIDTEIFIKRGKNADAPRTWEVTKNRDGEEGLSGSFTLQKIEVGLDKKGRPITSCVVQPCEAPTKNSSLTPKEKDSLNALKNLCLEAKTDEIALETWRNIRAHYAGDKKDSEKTTFKRVRNNLETKGYIAINGDMVRILR